MPDTDEQLLKDDFLIGGEAIADYLTEILPRPVPTKKCYHWIARGDLPAGRFAGKIISSKSAIRERLRKGLT